MQEVTCPQCQQTVQITPDAPLCSVCGVDLRTLLAPAATTRYFYRRASDLVGRGEIERGLGEVNRGLAYEDDSDLRLLGAMLAKRLGDFTQMRGHIAAIPVDDALRDEGEWLLRSQQEQQRAGRSGADPGSIGRATAGRFDAGNAASRKDGRRNNWPIWVGFALLALLVLVWATDLLGLRSRETAAAPTPTAVQPVGEQAIAPTDASGESLSASVGDPGTGAEAEESAAAAVDGAETPAAALPTPTATPVPTPTPAEVDFDLTDYLMAHGYSGLALLDVSAELKDGVATLTGKVPTVQDRDALLGVLRENPSIQSIDETDLVLSPPATYTVEVGDTLWSISFAIYGDTKYMDDIYRLNRDDLPSPEVLIVGMELKLPPVDPAP